MARILLIEDAEDMRVLLRDILEEIADHEVFDAADGEAGLACFRQFLPDLVITDIDLPKKSGLELVETFVREHPPVKIIAMTGSSGDKGDQVILKARVLGAHFALVKPVPLEAFVEAVTQALNDV